jgi:hypothetical protein
MKLHRSALFFTAIALSLSAASAFAEVASGPKEGEKVPALKALAVNGDDKDKEVDFAEVHKDKPTVYVFVAAKSFDRPMFRFLKKLEEELPEDAHVVAVWLPTEDVDQTKEYLPKIVQYFKKTAVVARKGKVIKSLGYQSLNETDAPEVAEVLKKSRGSGSGQ